MVVDLQRIPHDERKALFTFTDRARACRTSCLPLLHARSQLALCAKALRCECV